MKWLQVLLFNNKYSIRIYSFICTQLKLFRVLLCITNNSIIYQSFVYTVLFLKIQFKISHFFELSSNVQQFIWSRDNTLSSDTTPGQSRPGRDDSEGVLRIPQSSCITWASPLDCLLSYLGNSLEGICWDAVGVFYSHSRLGSLRIQFSGIIKNQIVVRRVSLLGRWIFGFSPLIGFDFLLLSLISDFPRLWDFGGYSVHFQTFY